METKICTKCGIEKPFSEYAKSELGKFGLRSDCKLCRYKYQKTRSQRPEVKEMRKKYRQRPEVKEKIKKYEQIPEVKEKIKKNKKKYRDKPENKKKLKEKIKKICPTCNKEYFTAKDNQISCSVKCCGKLAKKKLKQQRNIKYYTKICPVCSTSFMSRSKNATYCNLLCYNKQHNKQWDKTEYMRLYTIERLNTDPAFRIVFTLRAYYRKLLYISDIKKLHTVIESLGCSPDFLMKHLEQQFQPGMTKENHGSWHIDHILPCAFFDLNNEKDLKMCCHYTNLQPLWKADNLKKGNKIWYWNSPAQWEGTEENEIAKKEEHIMKKRIQKYILNGNKRENVG